MGQQPRQAFVGVGRPQKDSNCALTLFQFCVQTSPLHFAGLVGGPMVTRSRNTLSPCDSRLYPRPRRLKMTPGSVLLRAATGAALLPNGSTAPRSPRLRTGLLEGYAFAGFGAARAAVRRGVLKRRAIAAGLIPWENPCRFVVKGASTHDLSKARSDARISSRTELVSAASNGLGACVRNHNSLLQEEAGLERLLLPCFMTK